MNWIFLDFGSFRIKALKAVVDHRQVEIVDSLEFESHPEFFEGLDFPTSSAWAAASVQLHERNWLGEDAGAVLAQLPSTYLETRYLRFPFRSAKKIDRVLTMELESQIPFDVEDLIAKHHLLKGPGVAESPEALVHAMAYQRERIKAYEHELKSFQMSVPAFSTDLLCLPSLRAALPNPPLAGLLYFGHRKTQWILFQASGEILANRVFWWGGDSLSQSISTSLSLPLGEARDKLHRLSAEDLKDPTTKEGIQLRDVVDSQLNQFFNQFRQNLKAHLQAGLEIPAGLPVYILGGPAELPELKERFQQRFDGEFDLEVEDYPVENLTSSIRNLDTLPDLNSAYGLLAQALAQTRNQKSKLYNFSESNFQLQQNLRKIRSQSLLFARRAALILIAPIVYLILSLTLDHFESKRVENSVKNFIVESRLEVNTDQSVSGILDDLRRLNRLRSEMQEALTTDESGPLILLTLLSQQISSRTKIDINEMQVTETQVSFEADTDGEASHSQIMEAIRRLNPQASSSALKACDRYPNCQRFRVQFPREVSL